MCEITKDNFKEKLPEIRESLQKSKFIAVDLEFSALNPVQAPRLFDSNKERYAKLRKNLLQVVPLQIGITAFHFDNYTNNYFGNVFTFYVCPPAFADMDRSFFFQASTTNFLCLHNFDFNKFAYLGVPYLNNDDIGRLRQKLKSNDFVGENCNLRCEFDDAVKTYVPIVAKWHNKCKNGDSLEIPDIANKYKHLLEIMYFLHKHLRMRFKTWTYEKNGAFFVQKVSDEEFERLSKNCTLDEDILNDLTGFKHVFNMLTALRKPIVGHNVLQDLMIMVNSFETSLPESYSQYKQLTNALFPIVFDTKTIYYQLRPTVPKEKLPDDTSLGALFHYFKDGRGRHLVVTSSAIESNQEDAKYYHHAGWDSFCAGYIFIRLGYYNVARDYRGSRKFVSSEVINGLEEFKNCVNVIRGAAAFIRLDGQDPTSKRPPWLIVESLKNEPVDVTDLMSVLGSYGFVDIKKISSKGDKVLVAVDNFRAAKEISKTFRTNSKFQVKQYSALRHSPLAQAVLLGAVTISGTIILYAMAKR